MLHHPSAETRGLFARISGVSDSLRALGAGPRRKLRRQRYVLRNNGR
jgi:hypothetical protein